MRALPKVLCMIALASGCTDSCACGEGGRAPDPAAQAPRPSTAGQAAQQPADAGAVVPMIGTAPHWQPAPDSELTRQLGAAKQALETDPASAPLADVKLLAAPLGERIGDLRSDEELSSTIREGSDAKIAVAARNYRQGSKSVRVKVTDTALLPNARGVVSRRLTMVGNAAVGNEHGAFVRGYPAVVAHYPEQQVSRASAVIGNRYLVQVLVRGATDGNDALRVIEKLDFGKLAPKQGKIPPAAAK